MEVYCTDPHIASHAPTVAPSSSKLRSRRDTFIVLNLLPLLFIHLQFSAGSTHTRTVDSCTRNTVFWSNEGFSKRPQLLLTSLLQLMKSRRSGVSVVHNTAAYVGDRAAEERESVHSLRKIGGSSHHASALKKLLANRAIVRAELVQSRKSQLLAKHTPINQLK